ncbi:hypothetical protein M1N68_00110 [Peptococcaceae bacterium]|nr:hypothetical protein [Peptococcaceae bacterium]
MKYIKEIFKRCLQLLLKTLCGLEILECKNIQGKPEETTTMRRADLAAEVTLESGEKVIAVVEYTTRWKNKVPLKALEYRTKYK